MEPRCLLCVTPTPLPSAPVDYPGGQGHVFVMQAITLQSGSATTSGITDTATPSIEVTIQNGSDKNAGHEFRIDLVDHGQLIGTHHGSAGDLVGDPNNPVSIPVNAGTPLHPGENDLQFQLTDITDNIGPFTLPGTFVIIYDNAPPVVTLTPPPANPPQSATVVNVAATDLEDGVNFIQLTDHFNGRADKVTTLFSGSCDTAPAPTDYALDPSELGTHTLTVQGTDRANRMTTVSGDYKVVPVILPTPNAPALEAASDTGFSQIDGITNAQNLTFDITGNISPTADVHLFRNGTLVATRTGPGPLTDLNVPASAAAIYTVAQFGANQSFSPRSAPTTAVVNRTAPSGSVALQQSDLTFTGGSVQATTTTSPGLVVKVTTGASAKSDTVFLELLSVDGAAPPSPSSAQVVIPGGDRPGTGTASLPIPFSLSTGIHQIVVQATDAAGNVSDLPTLSFVVLATSGGSAPPTPVFNTVYDLSKMPGYDPTKREFPWSMAFDRTTQTFWVDLRGGDEQSGFNGGGEQVAQIDPATGEARIYNLRALDGQGEPHGIVFDFESHLQPRIWFTERESGYVSYLNLATNQLVSYDVGAILRAAGYGAADVHAISLDAHGNAWVSDMNDKVIIDLDFHNYPGQPPDLPIDSTSGSLIIHPIPPQLISSTGLPALAKDLIGPHGLDVETSDTTGEVYVWFSNLGGNGGASLLRPGAGPGGQDLWTDWDLSKVLTTEPSAGAPLFVGVDTNETPGVLADDRIVFTDPGSQGVQKNLVRELTPGTPDSSPLHNFDASSILTWQIPALAGGSGSIAQPNQAFPDREGNIVYIDRQSGVGRFNPNSNPLDSSPVAVPASTHANSSNTPVTLTPFRVISDAALLTTVTLPTKSSTIADTSSQRGLDQYLVVAPGVGAARGSAPFRSTLSAGSTLYASMTQSDLLTSTVFAEMVRRPVAVVDGPGDARRVFQVLRSGDIIMTWHGPGETIDKQVDLTAAVGGPTFIGDPAAATDASGVVEVFGRDSQGGIAEYRLDPAAQTWTALLLPAPPASSGLLASDPTAFTDPDGVVHLLTTTGTGHLLEYLPESGQVVDLTSQPAWGGTGPVYSSVGVTDLGGNDYVYATNQTGTLVQAVLGPSGSLVQAKLLTIPGGRDTEVFQDVAALTQGNTQYVFATDGSSRMVAITIGSAGQISAQNVSAAVETAGTAVGYSAYQMPFAGRVYGDLSAAVAPTTGDVYVEGTNGRDLVEFHLPAAPNSPWQITDLTNALPANKVFGTPAIYILPDGNRHILMINEDAELIEYYNLVPGQISTQNITLASGNSGSPPSFPTTFTGAGALTTAPLPQPETVPATNKVTHHPSRLHPKGPRASARQPASGPRLAQLTIRVVHPKNGKKHHIKRATLSWHAARSLSLPHRPRLVTAGSRKLH
jgi:hypothetical protein